MHPAPRVFLDTSVLKLAADRVVRGIARTRTVHLGHADVTVPVVQFRTVPKIPRRGTALAADAALLPLIAHLAIQRQLELLWHLDGAIEFARLPNTDSPRGRFYDAPLTWVQSPVPWGRIIAGGDKSMATYQSAYLRGRRDARFIELQTAVGMKAGAKNADNQLLDAWHIWCAERAHATHFLTCDYKLIRHLRSHRRTEPLIAVVTPRELLASVLHNRQVGIIAFLRALGSEVWIRLRRAPHTGTEELAALGEKLEREGYYD